jgi:plastocyanin
MRKHLVAAVLVVALVVVVSASASTPKLAGTVGPGYTISLTKGGKKVTKLTAGKYTFVVSDKATNHNFALDGPNGLAKTFTTVPFKGTKTVTLNLKKGTYKFYCQAHESTMFAHFKVS